MIDDKMIDDLCDSGSRMIAAEDALKRALAAEGSPAVRDTADGFFRALSEMMDSTAAIQLAVGARLYDLEHPEEVAS